MATPDKTPSDVLETAGVKLLDEEALKEWPPKPEQRDDTDPATEDTESTEGSGDCRSVSSVSSETSVASVAKKASFLFFTAPWCEASLEAAPRFARLHQESGALADFFQVDADRAPLASERLNVRSVPAIVAFARGAEISRRVGLADQEVLARLVKDAIDEAAKGGGESVKDDASGKGEEKGNEGQDASGGS